MPNIGEIRKGKEIGFHHEGNGNNYIWIACLECGKERWIRLKDNKPRSLRCLRCSTIHKNKQRRLIPMTSANLPTIGEVRHGLDVGKDKQRRQKFIWVPCVDCGVPRWCHFIKGQPGYKRCPSCWNKYQSLNNKASLRENSRSWRGGRCIQPKGYITIRLYPEDPYYPMADQRHYVLEHRLVMAKQFGRCLFPWEIVHHKHTKYPQGSKEDKGDNRPDNLKVVTDDEHKQISILETIFNKRIKILEARVTLLESENTLLRTQLEGNPHFTI